MSDLLQTILFQTAGEMRKGERNKSKNGSLVRGKVPRRHSPSQREEVLHNTQILFIQQEMLMVKSICVIFYWIKGRPSLTGVLLKCWWDPELVLVLLRWSSQLRLTGQGATAATWDISLFIWNSLLELKWWEAGVSWVPGPSKINVSLCALWRWVLLSKNFFIFWPVISDAFFDLVVRFHRCWWNEAGYSRALLLLWSLHSQLSSHDQWWGTWNNISTVAAESLKPEEHPADIIFFPTPQKTT